MRICGISRNRIHSTVCIRSESPGCSNNPYYYSRVSINIKVIRHQVLPTQDTVRITSDADAVNFLSMETWRKVILIKMSFPWESYNPHPSKKDIEI